MMIETPPLLLVAVLTLLGAGLGTVAWGRNFSRHAAWAVAVALVLLFGIAVFGLNEVFASSESRTWIRGWILPNDERGAVTVGIVEDAAGLVTSGMAALLAVFAMIEAAARKRRSNLNRPERVLAGIAISTGGVALAWVSLTPWLSLFGIGLTALGGFLALGEKWGVSDDEAKNSTRFAWEKWWGVVLAWVGAALLAGSRAPLVLRPWGEASDWGAISASDEIGAVLLILGLFVQLQSFPFLGWVVSSSSTAILPRVLLNQLAPGFAAFGLLIRLEPHLRAFGAFNVFGWVALFSATVTMAIGLLQATWRQSLAGWISAGFATAFAILSFSGAPGAFAFVYGLVLGTVVLSASIAALGSKEPDPNATSPTWLKVLSFLGVAAATGLAGFVSSFGVLQWVESEGIVPGWAALPFAVYFLFALNGWSLAWGALKTRAVSGAAWTQVLALFVLAGLSLAVVWTGSLTGGFVGDGDQIALSLIRNLFGDRVGQPRDVGSLVWVYLAIQALSFGVGYWMVGRDRDLWLSLREVFPRASSFVASAFHIETAATRLYAFACSVGSAADWFCDQILWERGASRAMSGGIHKGSRIVSRADDALSAWLLRSLSRLLHAPAKFLQLIQNGDVQWYVLFAIGSGAAILLHFLISKEWMT